MALSITKEPDKVLAFKEAVFEIKTDSITGTFYRICFEVLKRNSNLELILIGSDAVEPDSSGVASFSIAPFLKTLFLSQLYKHDFDGIFYYTQISEGFYYRFFYKYFDGVSIVKSEVDTLYSKTILNTELTDIQYKLYKKNNFSLYKDIIDRKFFLTLQPRQKLISVNQPERLFFIHASNHDSEELLYLKARIIYTNRQSLISTGSFDNRVTDVLEIKTDYFSLNLNTFDSDSDPIIEYSVWLEDSLNSVISEEFTYIIDRRVFNNERFIIFRNRLGGYDCVRCFGNKSIDFEFEHTIANSVLHYQKTSTDATEIHKLNTGYISVDANKYIQEIFESQEVYEIDNDTFYFIILKNDKTEAFADDKFIYNQTFEYIRDINDFEQTTSSGSNIIVDGNAQFACSVVSYDYVDGEIVIEIDVTNVSDYDGQTYLVFDFGDAYENGTDYELPDVSYFYYNDDETNTESEYTQVPLVAGENIITLSDKMPRALFIHYFIENTQDETQRYEAGKLIILREESSVSVIDERLATDNKATLLNNIEFSAAVLVNQLNLNVNVLSELGSLCLFYKVI